MERGWQWFVCFKFVQISFNQLTISILIFEFKCHLFLIQIHYMADISGMKRAQWRFWRRITRRTQGLIIIQQSPTCPWTNPAKIKPKYCEIEFLTEGEEEEYFRYIPTLFSNYACTFQAMVSYGQHHEPEHFWLLSLNQVCTRPLSHPPPAPTLLSPPRQTPPSALCAHWVVLNALDWSQMPIALNFRIFFLFLKS